MRVAIVHDSRTGNTAAAAEQMAEAFRQKGHTVDVRSISEADGVVAAADVLCVGSWTQGLFIILQHPTAATKSFIEKLPDLTGKTAVTFCSYGISPGSTLDQLARGLTAKGAKVRWRLPFRGRKATNWDGFTAWVAGLGNGAPAAPRP